MLSDILKGFASDPPNISLYSQQLDTDGNAIKNKYGFDKLTCNCGTNDTKNYHKQVRVTFSSWVTGVEMSDCLLDTHRHCFNHDCSERKRLGFPKIGHYDTWLIDALQLLVESNHGVILYPDWSNASDFISTDEQFGTVKIHSEQMDEALDAMNIDSSVKYSGKVKWHIYVIV